MKSGIVLLFMCLNSYLVTAQINISADQWRDDLRYLQETVHKDYAFLFKKTTQLAFDEAVNNLYAEIPALAEHEIIVGLARIVSLFQYGHTSIYLSGNNSSSPIQFHQMPYQLYHFNNGVFVQGVHKDYPEALGAKLLKVEGIPLEKAIEAVKPAFPVENEQFYKAYGLAYLAIPEILHAQGVTSTLKKSVTLTLEKAGKQFDVKFSAQDEKIPREYGYIQEEGNWLDARENNEVPLYLRNIQKIYEYEYLPEQKTVYVRHSQIQDEKEEAIPEFYDRVFKFIDENDVERLILDVRLNGGGNNYKNKPVITGIIENQKINQTGKLFVIIGRRTYSACQNLVNELSNYTNAIFVGEPTGENINFYGDNRLVTLPNSSIPVRLSFAWWQDKPQWENGPWTAPHLAVDLSFEDYRTNKDPVLDAALSFSEDHFITDPMTYLTNLYMAGKGEELMSEAKRMVADPGYRFFDFEGEFNKVGYNLMGRGQIKEAISVFHMIVELFPKSANARDSLGEGYWKAGQNEKATEYYNKAIEMDPDGVTGENARMMLKKINGSDKD